MIQRIILVCKCVFRLLRGLTDRELVNHVIATETAAGKEMRVVFDNIDFKIFPSPFSARVLSATSSRFLILEVR